MPLYVKTVTRRTSTTAIPVYDATSPRHHNLTLANGAVVHNTSKKARLDYQEVLPLKGKIINAFRAKEGQTLASIEVLSILQSMGFDPNKKDPLAGLRHKRIIFLADPDPDGQHINALLLALFAKYLRPMLANSQVWIVQGYEFMATVSGKRHFAHNKEDLFKLGAKEVQHIKGWGEISPEVLRYLAFDPATRQLIEVKDGGGKDFKQFKAVVGEDVAARKKLFNIQ